MDISDQVYQTPCKSYPFVLKNQNIVNILSVREEENKKKINNKKCQKASADGNQGWWGHMRLSREKANRKKRLWRVGSLEKTFSPCPEKEGVRWRMSERKGGGDKRRVGVFSSICPLPLT